MIFDEETEQAIDEYIEETGEARREHDLVFWEGCTVVTVPAGAPPEYITVMVDGVNDPNTLWRGVPGGLSIGDEVLVYENPISHRREIVGSSGVAGATTPFVHDHSSTIQGGDDLNPETLTPQTFIVGPSPAPYDTLGEAVVAVNAFGPAAATPCTIQVQGIVTAEAGDVTVPQYCHVEGLDEGSTVGMGANSLIMSDDSSLADLRVTSSDPVDAVRMNGVSNVVLRNVRGIQAEAADVFHVYGASFVEMYHCIAESTVVGATGFHVGDTAVVYMDDCIAYDSTNFADALLLDATMCTVVTRWCTFVGSGNDVQTGANSAWFHLNCYFYETNVTLTAGTHYALPTKRFNQTLVVAEQGGDFQALSEAITYINAQGDAAAGKLYGVLMLHGNFAEAGDVTIPQYTHVMGMGEGTSIEMGANTLIMSDDSSLQDVVVESTDPVDALRMNNADCFLRNVTVTTGTGGAICFNVTGDSYVEMFECEARASTLNVTGFSWADDSHGHMFHCYAVEYLNFTTALDVTTTNINGVYTRYCAFAGAADDVTTGAGSYWLHHKCEWDANNSTINGTETPLRDGAVEIASDAIRGHSSLFPDLGTAVAAQMMGNTYLAAGRDIYPDASTNGLNARFERLFGDDVPADPYQYTQRTFVVNDFPNHIAGFEDAQATPYNFGGAPGGFSLVTPAANYWAESTRAPHWLCLRNWDGAAFLYVQWTQAAAKTLFENIMTVSPNCTAGADAYLGEFRVWDVQAPGGADEYWAVRWNWKPTTNPDYPMRIGVWYGTGTTFAMGDGTLAGMECPFRAGAPHRIRLLTTAGPVCYVEAHDGEGLINLQVSHSQVNYPVSVKTARWVVGLARYDYMWIDQIVIT